MLIRQGVGPHTLRQRYRSRRAQRDCSHK
uniref:Uncharacterized protein n=1 Tax=Anguilla anguilla TaxID=7936 RepID=A0A0E9R8H5_ANGAN